MDPVYLDHAATTPLAPGVLDAMLPYLAEGYGNPSSVHARGRAARHAIEDARQRMAAALGVDPSQIWFTSGGTEANNTAIAGGSAGRMGSIVTCAAEHESVLRAARRLAASGRGVIELPVDTAGAVRPEAVLDILGEDVSLVSIMLANNETGAINPVPEIAAMCRKAGVALHTDAVQMTAYGPVSPRALGVDLVTISAHKIGGPPGIGALLVGDGIDCAPLIVGGRQERDRRAGTENVAGIVGFAAAMQASEEGRAAGAARVAGLRDVLARGLESHLADGIRITTPVGAAAPHILHCTFPAVDGRRVDGEMLLLRLDMEGVQASAGSACASGALEPSHVLLAAGLDREDASSALRLSLGRRTTAVEVERALDIIVRVVNQVRG